MSRCEICGKLVDKPITRKTCCVNKLHIFCSEKCLQAWSRRWLRNQEQIIKKNALKRW